jgi:hypothetical protein
MFGKVKKCVNIDRGSEISGENIEFSGKDRLGYCN